MYTESLVQPTRVETVVRLPSAADAVTTLGGHRDAPVSQHARFFMDVTAVSGTTPSMTMNVYAVVNNRPYWLGAFSAATTTGGYTIQLNNVPDLVTVAPSPISGTNPSFTYEVRCAR
jgi:hypothetical protein